MGLIFPRRVAIGFLARTPKIFVFVLTRTPAFGDEFAARVYHLLAIISAHSSMFGWNLAVSDNPLKRQFVQAIGCHPLLELFVLLLRCTTDSYSFPLVWSLRFSLSIFSRHAAC